MGSNSSPALAEPSEVQFDICDACLATTKLIFDTMQMLGPEWLEVFAKELCGLIPSSQLKDLCVEYAETNIQKLFEYLKDHLSPEEVCHVLHLCENTDMASRLEAGDFSCSACVSLAKIIRPIVRQLFERGKTIEEICKEHPMVFFLICENEVVEHLLEIIISPEIDDTEVCEVLRYC